MAKFQSKTQGSVKKIPKPQKIFQLPYPLFHNNLSFLCVLTVLHNWRFFQPKCASPPHIGGYSISPHGISHFRSFVLVIKISAILILARRRRVNFGLRYSDLGLFCSLQEPNSFSNKDLRKTDLSIQHNSSNLAHHWRYFESISSTIREWFDSNSRQLALWRQPSPNPAQNMHKNCLKKP